MGNVESIFGDTTLSNLPDQKQIYNKTQTTAILMKRIIDFILQNADIKDTISLATTKGCSQWLIIAKSEIEALLTAIEVEPTMGDGGILYLEKINKILPSKNSTLTEEQKGKQKIKEQYCTVIAFFSIRLFQVVGALALSVIDSDVPLNDYTSDGKVSTFKTDRSVDGIFGFRRPQKTRKLGDTISRFENNISRFTGNIGSKVSRFTGNIGSKVSRFTEGLFKGGSLNETISIINNYYLASIDDSNDDYNLYKITSNVAKLDTSFKVSKVNNNNNIYIIKSIDEKKKDFTFKIFVSANRIELKDLYYVNGNPIAYSGSVSINYSVSGEPTITLQTQGQAGQRTINNIRDYLIFMRNPPSTFRSGSIKLPQILLGDKELDFGVYISNVMSSIRELPTVLILSILKKYKYLEKKTDSTFVIRDKDANEESKIFISARDLEGNTPNFYYVHNKRINNKEFELKIKFTIDFVINRKPDNSLPVYVFTLKKPMLIVTNLETKKSNNPIDLEEVKEVKSYEFTTNEEGGEPIYIKDINRKTLPVFIQFRLERIRENLVSDDMIEDMYVDSKDGFKAPLSDLELVKKKDNPIIYSELWRELTKKGTPIKSFCVARALQLLNAEGLQSNIPEKIRPMVFNVKFPFVENKSLPKPNDSIITAAPIKALDTLFKKPTIQYTVIKDEKTELKTIGFPSDYDDKRNKSLAEILRAFGNAKAESLSDLKELSGPQIEKIDSKDKIYQLRLRAIRLFEVQFNHTRKVNNLLKDIFTFDKGVSVKPELLSKGVRGIEEIAVKARDLLVDYYSKCQTAYIEGVDVLKGKDIPVPDRVLVDTGANANI